MPFSRVHIKPMRTFCWPRFTSVTTTPTPSRQMLRPTSNLMAMAPLKKKRMFFCNELKMKSAKTQTSVADGNAARIAVQFRVIKGELGT